MSAAQLETLCCAGGHDWRSWTRHRALTQSSMLRMSVRPGSEVALNPPLRCHRVPGRAGPYDDVDVEALWRLDGSQVTCCWPSAYFPQALSMAHWTIVKKYAVR